ncbi:MAG: T9SS type A sorting domain-containing protein [Fluviicola sp.]|nr:T9SS type A sorting domain-containing protein [Fluviicola sp.]MBP6272884.1 T9SS type A sorting domain-containing protein [Fluviicola sp.]
MKLILFLLVFFPFLLEAQSTSFPDSNVVFVNSFYQELPFGQIGWPYQLMEVSNFCVDGSDTLIGNNSYKKVIRCPEQVYHGAYRSENRKVYFVPKDSTNQYLLYDFSVEVGDTIPQVYFEHFYGEGMFLPDYSIYYVDTIFINGNPHKRINENWVEGIGNIQGFLLEPYFNISQYRVELTCMSIDNAMYFPMQDVTPCPLDLAVSDVILPKIAISPNPTSDKLIIEGINDAAEINVINAQGKTVDFRRLSTHELAVSDLVAGVYFVQVTQNKQSAIVKFVKKD